VPFFRPRGKLKMMDFPDAPAQKLRPEAQNRWETKSRVLTSEPGSPLCEISSDSGNSRDYLVFVGVPALLLPPSILTEFTWRLSVEVSSLAFTLT